MVAIWRENMLGYLFVDTILCELRGTDNVQGQISERIFGPNGGYISPFILQFLSATRAVLKIGEHSRMFPSIRSRDAMARERKYLMDYTLRYRVGHCY